jgi:TP901 family phage tail tape measure protein
MSGVDAAATLSLKIDTDSAAKSLENLEQKYSKLRGELGQNISIGNIESSAKNLQAALSAVAGTLSKVNHAFDDIKSSGNNALKPMGDAAKAAASSMMTLAEATKANASAAQASSNAATTKLLRERAEAATLAAAAETRLAQASAASISSAQASSNAATAKLLRERAEAATLAAAAETRLAQASAASISAAQASSNAATAKLLRERAEAATLAAAAETRLAQASAASISAAQASSNAATTKLLRERAEAATLAANAELRLASATKANIGLAQAAYSSNLQRLATERASVVSGKSVATRDSLMNTTSVVAPDAKPVKELGAAIKQSADHQLHWNKVANEGHAAARGLAGGLGALWLTYGSLAPLLAGAAIAGSIQKMLSVGKELEFQFTMISAISNGATVDIEKFNKAVAGTMFTPVEAAQGLRVLAQAGLSVADATAALPSILKLATVGETDMGNAALSATAIMHAFGLSVNDMGHIGDVFSKAAAISATSVTAMMEAMRQASSVSDMFGVSMEETAAALATLANRGIEGSAAGTAIRNMVKELSSPATEKAAAAMKQFGIEAFNADGSSKNLMQNLQQLSEVTSVMTDKSRTRFLEVLFNERGVKAANILLTDMQKMKDALDDIRMSSEGLGFMTEAQLKLSQSTEGMLKSLKSGFQQSLSEVFDSVSPQVKGLIASLTELATSSEFKSFLQSVAESVVYLTKALLENLDAVKVLGLAYLGMKGIDFAVSAFKALAPAIAEVKLGMQALAVVDMTATAASMASTATQGQAAAASLAAVASTGTATGTVVSNLAAGFGRLINPLTIALAGIASLLVLLNDLKNKLNGVSSEQARAQEEMDGYNRSLEALSKGVDAGVEALRRESYVLDEQIRLLKEGKSAAEAYAQAKNNATLTESDAKLAQIRTIRDAAKVRVERGPVGGGDAAAESNEQKRNVRELLDAETAYQKALGERSKVESGVANASAIASESVAKKAMIELETQKANLKETLDNIKRQGDAAKEALSSNAYKVGVDPDTAAKVEERLKKQVGLMEKTKALRDNPLSESSGTPELQTRIAQLDSLRENSYEIARRDDRLFGAQTANIIKGYAERVKAANTEFTNYKSILDQRVKYGALAQGSENTLLEQAQSYIDNKTSALVESEKQELQTLLASKATTESEKVSIQTRLSEIEAIQRESEAKRAHIVLLNQEKDALKQVADARKLNDDIASFAEKEQLSRNRAIAKDYLQRNSSGETTAAIDAYYATMDRGLSKLKDYEAALRAAEKAQELLASQTRIASSTTIEQQKSFTKLSTGKDSSLSKYQSLFSQASVQYHVDEALLKAVAYVESRGNPNAVSGQGARGLMQLMPATAKSLGVTDSFDPAQNISGGAKLLRENLNASGGDVDTALKMYHGGTNRAQWGSKTEEYPKLVAKAYAELKQSLESASKANDVLEKSTKSVGDAQLANLTTVQTSVTASGNYTETVRSQNELVDESIVSEEAHAAAMLEAAKAVDVAREAYEKYAGTIEAQAEANAQLTESLKGPEEALKRMQSAFSASSAVMDATLNARKYSGYYTDLEGMRAEGNINKEKLSQLAELKSAYEAMGNAGAAAAKQVEAQMIELSAHLDPVADKIRGIFESAFEQFFNDVTQGTKTLKQAFKDLGKSILKSFGEMIAKNASQELMKILGGGLKPGESQGLFSLIGNLFAPNGAGSAGSDIATTGRSIFDSLKGLGTGRSVNETLKDIPVNDMPAVGRGIGSGVETSLNMSGIDEFQTSLSSLGSAANDSVANLHSMSDALSFSSGGLTNLSNSFQSMDSAALAVGSSLNTLEVSSAASEAAIAGSAVSSGLADVSLAATAVSANAASVGLSSVATSSSTDTIGSVLGDIAEVFAAKGMAFNVGGTKAFALGGTFTNSVVNKPTPFRFSSGGSFKQGVMGEAGPEAVMPLSRDSRGRLGVKASSEGGPINITVHVNGNSNAPDVRRAAGQGAREALAAFNGARRYA